MANCIVVFARLPVVGQVKTRLAASVGHQAACTFYSSCAEHALNQVARCKQARRVLQHSSADSTEDIIAWLVTLGLSQEFEVLPQENGDDLGLKMLGALSQAIESGSTKALVVGTDIPDITSNMLDSAFAALESNQVVLGPAMDGGYYLLGLTQPHACLFKDMQWSTASVYADTASRAAAAGLSLAPLHTLPTLQDIDTLQDLSAWWQSRGFVTISADCAPEANRLAEVSAAPGKQSCSSGALLQDIHSASPSTVEASSIQQIVADSETMSCSSAPIPAFVPPCAHTEDSCQPRCKCSRYPNIHPDLHQDQNTIERVSCRSEMDVNLRGHRCMLEPEVDIGSPDSVCIPAKCVRHELTKDSRSPGLSSALGDENEPFSRLIHTVGVLLYRHCRVLAPAN